MKNRLTIKEFSELSGVDSSTLRYWDEIGLFSPAYRNVDNNYRYYSPPQIIAVNFITVMSSLDVPLKTIKKMADNRSPEAIIKLIEQQEKVLDKKLQQLRESHSLIHTRLELINYGTKVVDGLSAASGIGVSDGVKDKITVLPQEEMFYILGARNEFKSGGGFYGPFVDFCNKASELRLNLSFPIGGYHDNLESFLKAPGEPNYFYSMDPTGNRKREKGEYLVGFHRGYYGQFGDLPERMMQYVKDNNLVITGPAYTIYLHDETCLNEPDQYLAQVSVAVS
jgi:DNA-binding transcriptional MerR regulator